MEPVVVLGTVLVALLGLLAGTVADSVAAREPQGVPIVQALRPQCGCGRPQQGREALPLLWLPGRRPCPECGRVPGRGRLALEVTCAGLFGALAAVLGLSWELPAYLYLAALGLVLIAIDLATRRLPNALTKPAYPIMGGLLLLPAVADGLWSDYARAALGGLALLTVYLVLVLVNPAGMGWGDVRLAGVLGIGLGWFGWFFWMVGTFAGFLLAGVVGIALLATRRANLQTMIPFGPFMVVGAFVGILGVPALAGYLLVTGALG